MSSAENGVAQGDAWDIVAALPPHHRDAFTRNTLNAVLAYADTGDVRQLTDFADDVLASLDFRRRHPDIARRMNEAPQHPVGGGRSVVDGFAAIREGRS